MTWIFAITAIFPVASLFILMAVFRKPAITAGPIVLVLTGLSFYFVWGMPADWIGASLAKGLLVTLEITLIIFGALLLLYVMKTAGALAAIDNYLGKVSSDRRIQAILLGWFFISFIEGTSGFGAPAALVAPLLVAIGFPALAAVMVALVGNSTSVTFGAVGLPILIGMNEGLGNFLPDKAALLDSVVFGTAFFHLFIGALVPLAISVMLTAFFGGGVKKGLAIWPYALVSGFAFTVPYFLTAVFLGPQFPSIVGSVIGGIIMIFLTKRGFMVPRESWDFPSEHPREELGTHRQEENQVVPVTSLWRAVLPYFLVMVVLIVLSLGFFGSERFLEFFVIKIFSIFGTGVDYSFKLLRSPGAVFALVAIFSALYYRLSLKQSREVISISFKRILKPAFGLVAIIAIVQIMMNSYFNSAGLPSATGYLAGLAVSADKFWVLIAPFVGLFGSFVAGSSTVSNLLFSLFQAETAISAGLPVVLILSLQSVGSAVGNMIAIHNILAVLATVGLIGVEGKIISRNLIPSLGYALLAGLAGLVLVLFFL